MNDDPSLRTHFRAAHRADEDGAPDFDAMWSSVAACHRRQWFQHRLVGITTIAAVLLAIALITLHRPPPAAHETAALGLPWRNVILLSEWRAPSDTLLSLSESNPSVAPSLSNTEH
jgi:hypothetical protein